MQMGYGHQPLPKERKRQRQPKRVFLLSSEHRVLQAHADTWVPRYRDKPQADAQKRLYNLGLLWGGPDSFAITDKGLQLLQDRRYS